MSELISVFLTFLIPPSFITYSIGDEWNKIKSSNGLNFVSDLVQVKKNYRLLTNNTSKRLKLLMKAICEQKKDLALTSISHAKSLATSRNKLLQILTNHQVIPTHSIDITHHSIIDAITHITIYTLPNMFSSLLQWAK